MRLIQILWLTIAAALTYRCSDREASGLIYKRLSPCNTRDYDSTVLCGQYSVFENPTTKTGRKIALNIVVIPALHKTSAVPIFCFEGGPGVGATPGGSFYVDSVNYYRLHHDVVLIDVRGTGGSSPLHCRQLQWKEDLEAQLGEMYPPDAVKDCYDSLSMLADLTQYTTTNMALDIDEVRRWLGYDKIGLFGLSYGTRLAQVYMQMFPGSVESCVLWSPTTTYAKMPLYHAKFAEDGLNKLFEDCEHDSLCRSNFPALRNEFHDLMERGRQQPFPYTLISERGDSKPISISWNAFQTKIRSLMYQPAGLRRLPVIIHHAYLGEWNTFLELFPKTGTYDGFLAEGLYLCVTCTEDVPFISENVVDSLTHNTFMGDYRIRQQQVACQHWTRGVIPEGYFEPLTSEIPTLIFSGPFDPVTPPSVAREIMKTLPNSFLVSIPFMSHVFDGLSNPECFDKMVVEFFDNPGQAPDSACASQMLPEAYSVNE